MTQPQLLGGAVSHQWCGQDGCACAVGAVRGRAVAGAGLRLFTLGLWEKLSFAWLSRGVFVFKPGEAYLS